MTVKNTGARQKLADEMDRAASYPENADWIPSYDKSEPLVPAVYGEELKPRR
jgi:hypothetical protein